MTANGQSGQQAFDIKTIKFDEQGLVPAIVQDAASKDVLMLAYMNSESLERTVTTGQTWFWSRSRSELWNKGATSGNVQLVRGLKYDCDADTLLVLVEPQGPACHNGTYTCFTNTIAIPTESNAGQVPTSRDRFSMLSALESVIASRDAERPEGAYTTYLFEQGVDKILKKVGEETAEVIIAAKNKDNDELRCETSDLIFHMMVLLRERKLALDDVMAELIDRHLNPRPNKKR